jgi:endonuclease YncB( thermonuclease family)
MSTTPRNNVSKPKDHIMHSCWLYIDGAERSVNEALVADGYAWDYMGDTKVKDFSALFKRRLKSK